MKQFSQCYLPRSRADNDRGGDALSAAITGAPNGLSPPCDVTQAFCIVRRSRAMNTDIVVMVREPRHAALAAEAEHAFREVEGRFSRFDPRSELSRLNESAGAATAVSDEMLDLLHVALEMRERTCGLFEPGILAELESAGYDRSFELMAAARHDSAPASRPVPRASISIDDGHGSVTLGVGVRLDFGGIGKGYAVDLAARRLAPAADFLVDGGGDIFGSGAGLDGDGWLASIADPRGGRDIDTVRLRDEALATSTTVLRRWRRGSAELHHIIDPRSGSPSRSDVLSASVIAPTATEADVFAKTALILGRAEGTRFLDSAGCAGLFVCTDGSVAASQRWPGGRRETGGG
jgi:thiamine biosynthesis lipoprotein